MPTTESNINTKSKKNMYGVNFTILYIIIGIIGFITLAIIIFLIQLKRKSNRAERIIQEVRNPNQRFDNPLYNVSTEPTFKEDVTYEINDNRPSVLVNQNYEDIEPFDENSSEA